MTAEQANVMLPYPARMTAAFGIGTFGGTLGAPLLLLRRQPPLPALLAAYILLYIGDIPQGVFAALGTPQITDLTLVMLIAAALLRLARPAKSRNLLA